MLIELLFKQGHKSIGIFDDSVFSSKIDGVEFLGKYSEDRYPDVPIIIAVGNSNSRKTIQNKIKHSFANYIHPSAQICSSVKIGVGCVVLQNAVIQANTILGNHVLINMTACIDHDCEIQDFATISSLSYIGSNCIIGEAKHIDPCLSISRFSTI